MRKIAAMGLAALALMLSSFGCSKSEKECLALRAEAFEIINVQGEGNLPHTCNDDSGCIGTEWPSCSKPSSKKNEAKIGALMSQFEGGGCKEDPSDCPESPDVYCKQGLCVHRFRAGGGA